MFFLFIFYPLLILSGQTFSQVSLWSGDGKDAITQETEEDTIKISHTGESSFAVTAQPTYLPVEIGDVLQISVDIKIISPSKNGLTVSFAAFGADHTVVNWNYGGTIFSDISDSFTTIQSKETVFGLGMNFTSCRITGSGPNEFEFTNFRVNLIKRIEFDIDKSEYSLTSNNIVFTFDSYRYNFTVLDKRNNKLWIFEDNYNNNMVLFRAKEKRASDYIQLDLSLLILNFECNAKYTVYFSEDNSIEFNL